MTSIRIYILSIGWMLVSLMACAQTKEQGFAVVELFTSEGCSSCPPADALVDKIQKENTGKPIYILAFHVDYWDQLGWKDKFSDPEFTKRQRQYADWLSLQTVYTPQIVVNGASEYVGSDQGKIGKAILAGLERNAPSTLTLNGKVTGSRLNIEYQGGGETKRSELVLALIEKTAQSNVKGGENSGRLLSHVQIVRHLLRAPIDANTKKAVSFDLPTDFRPSGYEIIGFVQDQRDGHISSAARLEL